MNVFVSLQFYEELVQDKDSENKSEIISTKPVNKITKFNDSDSSGSEEESDAENVDDGQPCEAEDTPAKKQRIEKDTSAFEESVSNSKEKTIDALIEDELKDLGDRNKVCLNNGWNICWHFPCTSVFY